MQACCRKQNHADVVVDVSSRELSTCVWKMYLQGVHLQGEAATSLDGILLCVIKEPTEEAV